MSSANTLWAKNALTPQGWQSGVLIEIDEKGVIACVKSDTGFAGHAVDLLVPAMTNLHSHAFQRAMAGMTETRGADPEDSFWSWRKLMYRFLDHLGPDEVEAIAAFGQIEMLEAGFGAVGEFHYLHNQPDGTPYSNPAEMIERIVAATNQTGIGLTLLPVLYEQGGCDGQALLGGQRRFAHSIDSYGDLFERGRKMIESQFNANIGVAPHSLRAVSNNSLKHITELAANRPIHIHIAEQQAEVEEVLDAYGARPVEWLLEHHPVGASWCFVHATQMNITETQRLAASQCVVGLCPITESNLGDGIFDGKRYLDNNGNWGIGTDSNIRISLSEELKTFEYSQRLRDRRRVVYAKPDRSNGRALYDAAARGGAQALQRQSGQIAVGQQADLLALDANASSFIALQDDGWLDAWIFANDDSLVSDVWVAGKHLVSQGRHIDREPIELRYRNVMKELAQRL